MVDKRNYHRQRKQTFLNYYFFSFAILTSLLAVTSAANMDELKFQRYQLEDGLSQGTIFDIVQDSSGFIWFTTQDGLNKFDGYRFTVYKHNPGDSSSISDSYTGELLVDRKNRIWIATKGGGLNCYDRVSEKFIHYKYDPDNPKGISSNQISCMIQDHLGYIWIGTRNGLNRLDPDSGSFQHFCHQPEDTNSISDNEITALGEDPSGILWIGTKAGGLNKFDRKTGRFFHYRPDSSNPPDIKHNIISEILIDRRGILWIATAGGLFRFDSRQNVFRKYEFNSENIREFSPVLQHNGFHFIRTLLEDSYGNIWIGNYFGGLSRLNPENGELMHLVNDPINPFSLSDNHVLSLFESREKILWVGTLKGLNKLDLKPSKFNHRKIYISDQFKNSQSVNFVVSILEDTADTLWCGTFGEGLLEIDRITGTTRQYRHDPWNPNSISSNDVWEVFEDEFQNIWVGTSRGLDYLHRGNSTFRHYLQADQLNTPDGINMVRSIASGDSGYLWVATFGNGLFKFNPENGNYTRYLTSETERSKPNLILSIHRDYYGKLWLGTDGSGLIWFDPEKEKEIYFPCVHNSDGFISNYRVNSIYEWRPGYFWIGTNNGLNRLIIPGYRGKAPDPSRAEYLHLFEKDGLPNSYIYGVLGDNAGNIWMSTNKGLSCLLNPDLNDGKIQFRNYDVLDGLQSNEFNTGAYFKNRNGELFFGGINGLNSFYPAQVTDNPFPPPVVITSFKISGREVPLESNISGIRLHHNENVFSIEFAALDFTQPVKNRYAYKLEGFDKDWVYAGNRRFVNYTNLNPGQYTFRVKASNNDGIWNETGASLSIRVVPPFWKTRLAYAGYLLAFITSLFSFIKWRSFKYRRDNQILEQKIEEKTRELRNKSLELQESYEKLRVSQQQLIHLEKMKAIGKLASGMAHDFNNLLTIIMGSVQMLQFRIKDSKDREKLENIEKAALDGAAIIKKIQDFSRRDENIAREPVHIYKLLQDVIEMTRFKWLDQRRVEGIVINVETDIDDIPAFKGSTSELRLAFTNIMINAVEAFQKSGRILISAKMENDWFVKIIFEDQGAGMPPETTERIFEPFFSTKGKRGNGLGLNQVYGIITRHKGTIEVQSEVNKGTRVIIRLPVEKIAVTSPPEQKSAISQSLSCKRIFIVEDEEIICNLYREFLKGKGFELTFANSGESAMQIWEDGHYNLIICDLGLPGIPGWDFIDFVREKNQEIPVLVVTGWGNEIPAGKIEQHRVQKIISKPIIIDRLLESIRELLSEIVPAEQGS